MHIESEDLTCKVDKVDRLEEKLREPEEDTSILKKNLNILEEERRE